MNSTLSPEKQNNRQIAIWLFFVCGLVFAMVLLGGVTRLTDSGLSMVEWEPIMGTIPPLSSEEWLETFKKYQQFPEYQKLNYGMSLDEFKSIFWFEYGHRLLGRTIGLAFLLPFLYFWLSKKITRSLVPKLVIMFILGGMQGLLGWYMVKSGLVHNPHVSQYRLTAHLLAAVAIYTFMLWVALGLIREKTNTQPSAAIQALKNFGVIVCCIIILMIISGGFVAGTRAGFTFNTFPTMHGEWLPPGGMALSPWWLNFFENLATVQFTHRVIALVVTLLVLVFWWRGMHSNILPTTRISFHLLLVMLVIQLTLGITTLLYVVPVPLAAAHQGGALLLLTIAVIVTQDLWRQSSRA